MNKKPETPKFKEAFNPLFDFWIVEQDLSESEFGSVLSRVSLDDELVRDALAAHTTDYENKKA